VHKGQTLVSPGLKFFSSVGFNNGSDGILTLKVEDRSENVISNNVLALTPPKNMKLPPAKVTAEISDAGIVTLKSDKVALYVTLTTSAQGRFSENAFLMDVSEKKVVFMSFSENLDVQTLRSTLRVEHLQQNL